MFAGVTLALSASTMLALQMPGERTRRRADRLRHDIIVATKRAAQAASERPAEDLMLD